VPGGAEPYDVPGGWWIWRLYRLWQQGIDTYRRREEYVQTAYKIAIYVLATAVYLTAIAAISVGIYR
jgi:hypothetical protein